MKNPVLRTVVFAWLAAASPAVAQISEEVNDLTETIATHPRDAHAYLERGKLNIEVDFESAIADMTKAIKLDPTLTAAWLARADAYLGHNDWHKAMPDYNVVLRRDPQNEDAHAGRAQCYYYIKRGDALDLAVADYTEAIRLSPRDADLYSKRGHCYSEMGDSAEHAIADYTQVIALTSDKRLLEETYDARGVTNSGAGHYEAAAADFSKLLLLRPGDPNTYTNRGDAYAHMGDFDKAIADYNAPLVAYPSYIGGHEALAQLYEIMGQPEKARAEREVVLKSRQDSVGDAMPLSADLAYLNLGELYMKRGDYPKALAAYKHGMRLNPHDWCGFQELGEYYAKMGNREKAMPCLNKAVKLASIADGDDDPIQIEQALYSRAESCIALGDYAQAIADYRTIIGFYPRNPGPYGSIARLLATCPDKKFRDSPKAIALAQKACTLSAWRDTAHIDTLAAAEAQAGKFDDAVKWQQWAIELADAQKGDLRIDNDAMKAMAERLALYERKKPWIEKGGLPSH